jgi:hypothetical protein
MSGRDFYEITPSIGIAQLQKIKRLVAEAKFATLSEKLRTSGRLSVTPAGALSGTPTVTVRIPRGRPTPGTVTVGPRERWLHGADSSRSDQLAKVIPFRQARSRYRPVTVALWLCGTNLAAARRRNRASRDWLPRLTRRVSFFSSSDLVQRRLS